MDEQVVADASRHIADVALELYRRDRGDDQSIARRLAAQVGRIARQLALDRPPETPCKRCGRPVPDVPIGRPRTFCSEPCRRAYGRRRRKVADFPTSGKRIEA